MKQKKKRVSVPLFKTEEVFDPKEGILDQNLQKITTLPHEIRGERLVNALLNSEGCCLRTHSSCSLKPVDVEKDVARDLARHFHQEHPDLNWGASNY